jgi:hypothetical protein
MVSLAAIRSAVHPRTAVLRTVLLSLLGVIVLVAGLLAMHTLSIDAPTHTAGAAVAPMALHADDAAQTAEMPSPSDDCGPTGCEPMLAIGVMTCVLALLLVSLVFGAAPHVSRWFLSLQTLGRARLSPLLAAAPAPPSLISLSISRT